MEHSESAEVKWAVAAQRVTGKNGKRPVRRTSESVAFQKCPSVDIHSGVTLQQTYYLLFCHFGFSTSNLGPDSISAPQRSASLTIKLVLFPLALARRVCPFRESTVLFTALHPTLQKHLALVAFFFSLLKV